MKFLFAIPLLFVWSLAARPSQAAPDWESLLQKPERPSVAEVRAVNLPNFDDVPSRMGGRMDANRWSKILLQGLPYLIAQMEMHFPGATWAFLGRDTMALADGVEAFYDHLGQSDRVVRIGISKPSFWQAGNGPLIVDNEQIELLLKSHGFDLKNVEHNHPYVLIDTLSQGAGRQGRVIISAIYHLHDQRGGKLSELVRKMNMMGLATSTYQHPVSHAPRKVDGHLTEQERSYDQGQINAGSIFDGHQIVVVPEDQTRFHESGYEHFTGAWHGSYDTLVNDGKGGLIAQIGPPHDELMKKHVLWLQKKVIDEVSTEDFVRRVESHAQELGYEFSRDRPGSDPIESLREMIAEVDKKLEGLDPISHEEVWEKLVELGTHQNRPAMSPGGREVLRWLQEDLSGHDADLVAATATRLIADAKAQSYLTATDLKTLLREVFADGTLSTALAEALKDLKANDPDGKELFEYEEWIKDLEGHKTYRQAKLWLDEAGSCSQPFGGDFWRVKDH